MSKPNISLSSSHQKELSIRSEPVQRIYNFYINNVFFVNRRYQRKLVWNIEEKTAFIDSILQGFPVPIILLAETKKENIPIFEIIDGMQRLNAIVSFIEGEFDINGKYFDLQTMVESKSCLDEGNLEQNHPILERKSCELIASYVIPLSVYSFDDNKKVDEVFRRINSNGKHLSKQELRSAGATSRFANLVRLISTQIRTDTSDSDILLLNNMKEISITNKKLPYGIRVDDIFWVKNKILTKEMLRESKDEEIVADILAYMLLSETPRSNASVLDGYYGFRKGNTKEIIEEEKKIEAALKLKEPDLIKQQFILIYDNLRKILRESNKTFNNLICRSNLKYIPRPFQIVFLAFYDLIVEEKMEISDCDGLIDSLKNIKKDIDTPSGPTWSYQNKIRNIKKIKGIVREFFKKRNTEDPAYDCWITEFETLLTKSKTEQTLYDFKQGFTKIDGEREFDQGNFDKIIKTLTAMANHSPNATGYVCVGVADNEKTAKRIEQFYKVEPVKYKGFKITGIEHEAEKLKGSIDEFVRWLIQKLSSQKIEKSTKDNIGRNIKIINYLNKTVVLFSLSAKEEPITYDDKFYQRIGSSVDEIKPKQYKELFNRWNTK